MRLTQVLFSSAAAAAFAMAALPVHAAQTVQQVGANCTTSPTGSSGARHSCKSEQTTVRAPEGYVFIKDGPHGPKGGKTTQNGDRHECVTSWGDWSEVIAGSGIYQPRSFTLSASATSPSGYWAGRGWVGCSYTLNLTSIR